MSAVFAAFIEQDACVEMPDCMEAEGLHSGVFTHIPHEVPLYMLRRLHNSAENQKLHLSDEYMRYPENRRSWFNLGLEGIWRNINRL